MLDSHIFLRNARFHAYHGVLSQERIVGNDYRVSVDIAYDFEHAMDTDELDDTISYADVYELVKTEMQVPSKLLEHVAGRVGRKLITTYPMIRDVKVEVTKVNPPMGADCDGAGVSIHLINNKTLR